MAIYTYTRIQCNIIKAAIAILVLRPFVLTVLVEAHKVPPNDNAF